MDSTKEKIEIIIVEDDLLQQEMYRDTVEEFNIENKIYQIIPNILINDDDIPSILYNKHIDAILIDLNWGPDDKENKGNLLAQKIYEDCRIPIFIITGNLQFLYTDYEESPIFKKYQRDEVEVYSVLKEIQSIFETGYTKALGGHSKIDEMLSKVFWEHVSTVFDEWKEQKESERVQRMLRFTTTRINEMLTVNTMDKHDNYDALEFYIKPAIKTKPFTGDIISYNEGKYIVLTAACDMEQDNSEYVVLCQIDFKNIDNIKSRIKSGSNTAEKELNTYVNNSKARYHLLPPCNAFSGGLIDFQKIMSIDRESFYEYTTVIASVNPVFIKDIQARFSHYYGRQGQPQLDQERIIKWIKDDKS